jgi:hypothetical protein
MKRIRICLLALLLLSWPRVSQAQYRDEDQQNPTQYNDVEDGQLLKLASYVLTPVGMALEWGVTRPLHSLATQSAIAPVLSGDTQTTYFGQVNNAAQVPPGTFGPYTINPTNNIQPASAQTLAPLTSTPPSSTLAPAQSIPPSSAAPSGGQPVIH